jgi:aryl-phospho-beta-D-glucosidase BglC (GH1 family)
MGYASRIEESKEMIDIVSRKRSRAGTITAALATSILLIGFASCSGEGRKTPVAIHGQLRVEGTGLVDSSGSPIQLKGPSLFDSLQYGQYAGKEALTWLRTDWKANAVRLPMYLLLNNYYIGKPGEDALRKCIRAAVDAGLYVIADWHVLEARDPRRFQAESIAYFTSLAEEFGSSPNIVYEICNEPNGADVDWSGAIKPYAEAVIAAIRAKDPDGVVLVGTPSWSSHPEEAALDPVKAGNILYVLHFYAGSHGRSYRDRIDEALAAGAPVFITEWGCTQSSGRSRVYAEETWEWLDFLDERGISSFSWSLSDKLVDDTSILKQGASYGGAWGPGTLTEAGALYRMYVRGEKTGVIYADDFESGNFQGGRWNSGDAGMDKGKGKGYKSAAAATLPAKGSFSKTIDISPYASFSLRARYRTSGAKKGDILKVEWYDGSAWNAAASFPASSGWKGFAASLPDTAARVDGGFRFSFEAASPDAKAWIDDVVLEAKRK